MQYYIIYKPYKMISQFTSSHKKKCLDLLEYKFPKDVYPVGRLDENSEGLLILTNDKTLNHKLLNPQFEHKRIYWAHLQGKITTEALKKLEGGLEISVESEPYFTKPAKAKVIPSPKNLPDRGHPVKDSLPTSWIELTLTEGKNRQVRRMTAGVGFPTLRLIRVAIEDVRLENMQPGEVRELKKEALLKKLNIQGD
jgi:23S rRNA pseudouridine2457 synthase